MMSSVRPRIYSLLLFLFLLFFVDQGTKWWAAYALTQGSIPVVGSIFEFRLVFNTGSAFGLVLLSPGWLGVMTVGMTIFFLGLNLRLNSPGMCLAAGSGLFLGGAWGNQLDRLRLGYVIDFMNPSFWPTFNVADLGIVVGLILIFIEFWRLEHS